MTALIDSSPTTAPVAVPRRRRRLSAERTSLLILLALTALGYLWTLSESGYANQFYAAAAQAGSQSWKAWFFGALDAGNAITVDKPPAALWVMGLSARLFGVSSWSILAPEALMGVGTVWLTYATVRRVSSWQAGIAAGAFTALTPAAALMFRFDNPDALLLLLLAGAGYCTLRATELARGRWLVLAGILVGFGFLTKMLQAFLVLPAFALVYLIAAPTSVRKRITHLLVAFVAVIVSAGWWVAIVELVPDSWRPYVDGSTHNSILELVFGYNGFGRITGDETGGLGNAGFSSGTGFLRLFQGVSGGMVAWLLPAALVVLVAGLIALRKAPRTDLTRAALLLTGGSMVVTGLVFSFMAGIYHDYYTIALAPWIAATAVLGTVVLWRRRGSLVARLVLAAAAAGSTVWAVVLLGQSGEEPYGALRWPVLLAGLGVTGGFAFADLLDRKRAATLLTVAAVTLGIGPAAYTLQTISTAHTGSIVSAGPYSSGLGGPGGGGPGGGPGGGRGGFGGGTPPQMSQQGQTQPGQTQQGQTQQGQTQQGQTQPGQTQPGQTQPGGMTGGTAGGGLLGGTSVSEELTSALQENAGDYRWVAATTGAQNAASYELATGESVMAIGGFNGTTPSVSLAQFKEYVAQGRIHYFIAGGGMGARGGSSSDASAISEWVSENFTASTVGGVTVYDLTQSSTSAGSSTGSGEVNS